MIESTVARILTGQGMNPPRCEIAFHLTSKARYNRTDWSQFRSDTKIAKILWHEAAGVL